MLNRHPVQRQLRDIMPKRIHSNKLRVYKMREQLQIMQLTNNLLHIMFFIESTKHRNKEMLANNPNNKRLPIWPIFCRQWRV